MNRIIKGDKVRVISGKNRGFEGIVLTVFPKEARALVEGVNKVKKHKKPDQDGNNGGIIEQEAPIRLCKLAVIDTKKGGITKIKFATDKNGKKIRIAKATGSDLSSK